MTSPTTKDFEAKLNTMLLEVKNKGFPAIILTAGELHREVGGYPCPSGDHRMRACCNAMYQAMQKDIGDITIEEPPSGQGANLTIKYILPPRSFQETLSQAL